MKLVYRVFLIILIPFSSCHRNHGDNHGALAVVSSEAQKDSSALNEQAREKRNKNVQKQPNPLRASNEKFITKLQGQVIQPLPFSFAPFLLDSLHSESNYDELLFSIAFQEIDTSLILNKLKDILNYNLTIDDINKDTEPFLPKYYGMLLSDNSLSNPYFFKRLPPLDMVTEVILTATKIKDDENDFTRGLIFELITYDIKTAKIKNRKRVFTGGIAEYDNGYYEGFEIDNDYKIKMKSYMGFEYESTTIERELKVLPDGKIIEQKKPLVNVIYSEENYE